MKENANKKMEKWLSGMRALTEDEEMSYQKALRSIFKPTGINQFDEYEDLNGHLNLDTALEEVKMLYRVYGLEKDENLTKDAQALKSKILSFVNEIKKL